MDQAGGGGGVAGAEPLFVVTVQGAAARSELVRGLEGVRTAFLEAAWRGTRALSPEELEAALLSLEDASAWASHGRGDGQPYWHWWAGFPDGAVSVQRLTHPLREQAEAPRTAAEPGPLPDAGPVPQPAQAPAEPVGTPWAAPPGLTAELKSCARQLRGLAEEAGLRRRLRLDAATRDGAVDPAPPG